MDVHDRVVVHVDDPHIGGGLLRDLVDVPGRRDAGADVDDLADARVRTRSRTARRRKARFATAVRRISGASRSTSLAAAQSTR